jgi:hypothetical protein
MFKYIFLIVLFSFKISIASPDAKCQKWFNKEKIKKDKDCLLRCTSTITDMGTFSCPNQCEKLCASPPAEKLLFQLSDLYPGLTAEERALTLKEPQKMLKAYQLSWAAESLCLKEYPTSETNDESDACRHFVWAALLHKEFGQDFSSKVLNAHEQDPKQPKNQKDMDVSNNRVGQQQSEWLMKENKFTEDRLIDIFKDKLKTGKITVLGENPKGGKK